jgi:hypothetical protein
MLNNILPLAQVWRALRITPYRLDFWKPVVAAAVAGIVAKVAVFAIDPGHDLTVAILAIAATGITYLALLLVLRLDEQDRAMVGAIVGRRVRPADASSETPGPMIDR